MDTTKRHIYTIFTVTVVLAVVIAGTSAGALSAVGDSTEQTTGNMGEADLTLVPPSPVQVGENQFDLVLNDAPDNGFRSVKVKITLSDTSTFSLGQFQNSSDVAIFSSSGSGNSVTLTLVTDNTVTDADTPFVLGQLPVNAFQSGATATLQLETICPNDPGQTECGSGTNEPIDPTTSDTTFTVS